MDRKAQSGFIKWLRGPVVLAAVVGLTAACDDSTSPTAGANSLTLSFGVTRGAAGPAASLFAAGLELTDGDGNTLVIESAELVLREIEFEKVETAACDSEVTDEDCGEVEIGPMVLPLALDGSLTTQVSADIAPGFYDEVEFEIHKPEDEDLADADFLTENPDFLDISVRVTGTWNSEPFTYTSDLNAEQEIEFPSPIEVGTDPAMVTLTIDLDTWYRTSTGTLVDPRTANKGEVNESLVKDNIQDSIEGFRDDDQDGVPHDDDLDEHDGTDGS